jgi:hypothetical protein
MTRTVACCSPPHGSVADKTRAKVSKNYLFGFAEGLEL